MWYPFDVRQEYNINVEGLRDYQLEDARKILELRNVLLASEPGLGKTVTSLAAIDAANAYPCTVVTVTNGCLTWAKEALFWLKKRKSVSVIVGTGLNRLKEDGVILRLQDGTNEYVPYNDLTADIVIVHYGLVSYWVDALLDRSHVSILIDESHRVKSRMAQRTKAVKRLADKGFYGYSTSYKVAISGTPVINRPSELISQLEIIDRLNDVGGYYRFTNFYCGATEKSYRFFNTHTKKYEIKKYKDINGAKNLKNLNEKLLKTCMIRRRKEEVLKFLAPKQRIILPVEITNRYEYDHAESDFVDWICSIIREDEEYRASIAHLSISEIDKLIEERVQSVGYKARENKTLMQIVYLRQLAMCGKMEAVKEFIEDYQENETKLLVFSYHQDMQQFVQKSFPKALHIFAKDSKKDREDSVNKFQSNPKDWLMNLSLASCENLTLTAASSMLCAELHYSPSLLIQAEDRAYGRANDPHSIDAHYILGVNTIDERMWYILQEKMKIAALIVDGKVEDVPTNYVDDIQKELKRSYFKQARQKLMLEQ